ncbi:hypothetical protein EFK50_17100 [Nocardioides marmoriginsengisoli]|uniref:Recombinase A n=1 Tax=Nocardioides marmoriginsengisoli TaxID=661483 RepID=A0A3N0CCB9_9ACTN|nr:hypothetical protein [Nocardioides marmoriginsengisoli]RNL61095.1 hypothetical protein EFK50_17100 [Nocardioides marmoriginsengisoli]
MSAPIVLAPREQTLQQLQERIRGMQDGVPRVPLPTHPVLDGLLQLRTGGAYEVDRASLGMALLATPSAEGSWVAVVGAPDFGVEAAAELGVDLTRTVLVPDPGEHWLETTAALVDVVGVVLLRPPVGVTERTASRIAARLRKRSAALIVQGEWPGAEARISLRSSAWSGAVAGHGRLRSRRVVLGVQRGSAPVREVELWFPSAEGPVVRIEYGVERPALDAPRMEALA